MCKIAKVNSGFVLIRLTCNKLLFFSIFLREKNLNKLKRITQNVLLRPFHSHQIIKGRGRFMAEFCGNGRVSQNVCLYTSTAVGQLPVSQIVRCGRPMIICEKSLFTLTWWKCKRWTFHAKIFPNASLLTRIICTTVK